MKDFFKKLFKLSLLQQLAVIILISSFIFVAFFSFYLKKVSNEFTKQQVVNMLSIAQSSAINSMDNNFSGYSEEYNNAGIVHVIFRNDIMSYVYPSQTSISQENLYILTNLIKNNDFDIVTGTVNLSEGYYYRLAEINENTTIISVVPENYNDIIEEDMIREISNSSAFIFAIIFILLLLWVSAIIFPLQKITSYIKKIKNGDKKAQLDIERSDEIGQLADALVQMNNEIILQEETKEEMIHNISHDLKTPIATIKSYAQSIKDGIYPYDTLDKSVEVIITNAERLEKKVYSLLFLNRVDYVMEQETNNNQTTDMTELIGSVLVQLKMIRPEIKITTDIVDTTFKGEQESWYIVVSNLLDNALRYAVSNVHITVDENIFTISNDGENIKEDSLKKIFKPFEKGDKGKFGLGLSICMKICNGYGYNIYAQNKEDGVVFIIETKDKNQNKDKKTILPIRIDKK